MATPDIEVLVGVLGGFSIASGSGKLIHNQIEGIIRQTQSRVKLQINIDKAYFKKQVEDALKAIQWTPNVNPPAGGGNGGNGGNGGGNQATELQKIINLQKQIGNKRLRVIGKEDTEEGKVLLKQLESLRIKKNQLIDAYAQSTGKTKGAIAQEVLANEQVSRILDDIAVKAGRKSDRIVRSNKSEEVSLMKLAERMQDYYRLLESAGAGAKDPKRMADLRLLIDSVLGGKYTGTSKDLLKQLLEIETGAKNAGLEVETLGHRIKRTFKEKFGYGVIAAVAMQARRAIRQIYTNVVELDTAMTELRKVTNETADTYNKFLDGAAIRAKTLGATLSDTVKATADFARLGYNIGEASSLADAALVYKNVGDGIDDINVASESIISTMQGFGIAASDAMTIVDKFNEVGNNFAISSAGIGEALTRSSAAMNAAGNSIDETIALVTAANTVLQNPDVVGTTMKTMSMYLRAAKSDLESAGEDTDGMAESVSELRKEILALTGGKVDIQSDDSTFKNTYQILKELSVVWNDLTDVSKANILETIASKRNANAAAAILENFDLAEEALATSQEAAGSALEENEKYLDSINGKIAKLKASYQEFSENVLGSGVVKGVIDFGIAIVEVFNKMSDGTSDVAEAIAKLSLGFVALKSLAEIIIGSKISKNIANTVGGFKEIAAAAILARKNCSSISSIGSAFVKGINPATKLAIAIAAIATACYGVYRVYSKVNPTVGQLADKAKESAEELSAMEDKFKDNEKRIKELQSLEMPSLTEQGELERLTAENDQLERRIEIQRQLANADALKAENEAVTQFERGYMWEFGTGATEFSRLDKYLDDIEGYDVQIASLEKSLADETVGSDEYNEISKQIESVQNARDNAYETLVNLMPRFQEFFDAFSGQTEDGNQAKAWFTSRELRFDRLDGDYNLANHARDTVNAHKSAKDQLDKLRESGDLTGETLYNMYGKDKSIAMLIMDLKAAGVVSEISADGLQKFVDAYYGIEDAAERVDDSGALKLDGVKKLTEQYEALRDAKKEYSERGTVSIDSLETIIEKYGEVGKEQTNLYVNGVISAKEMFDKLRNEYDSDVRKFNEAQIDKLSSLPEFYNSMTKEQRKLVSELASRYNVDLGSYKTVEAEKLAFTQQIIKQLMAAWDKYHGMSFAEIEIAKNAMQASRKAALAVSGDDLTWSLADEEEFNALIDTYYSLKKMNDEYNAIVGDVVDPSKYVEKESSSSTDKFKQNLEKQAKILQHHREMDKITAEEYYNGLEEILKQYKTNTVKYAEEIADLEQQIFNGRRELFADLTADRQYHADRMIMAGDYEQAKAINQAILDDTKKQIDAAIAYGLDENSDYVQELRKQAADAGKAILDAITESFDQFMSYADNFNVWKDLDFTKLEYLEKLLNDIDALYMKGAISWKEYVEAHNNVAEQMYDLQKDSIETIIDMTMEMIEQEAEDKVDALEKQKDAYQDIIDLKKKELNIGKEQDNHDREVEEKIRNIARLRSRISQLELDDSREAQAEKAALEEELYQEERELADLQNDYALDRTIETLDESAEAFEDAKDEEIRVIEESVDTWAEVYALAIDRIDNDFENLYEDLNDWMAIHRDSIDGPDSLKTSWETVLALKKEYANVGIEDIYDDMGTNVGLNPGAPDDPEAKAILERMKNNSIRAKQEGTSQVDIDGDGKKENLHQMNKDLANDYYELTGQKLYYNNGWRYDNENGDFVYDVSGVKRNPTTGGGNVSGGGNASGGTSKKWADSNPYNVPSGTIKENDQGSEVAWVQYQLKNTVAPGLEITWQFGPNTKKAVKSFQDKYDLGVDGIVGRETLAKLKQYHTGGVVDGTGAINDHEVLALLEKGELVLDDKKKSNLKLMFAKIGNMIEWASAAGAIANVRNPAPGKAAYSGDTWAPNFEVTIHHNGNMTDADAKRYGRQIGNEALEQLRIAFNKRGK